MFELPDAGVGDFWLVDTAGEYHLFFLRASRALLDPDRRHRRAGIGHAVSTDLRSWRVVADALTPGDEPRWDDLATWTGCVVAGPDGTWRMFYTGLSRADDGFAQRIGVATSADLYEWHSAPEPVLAADARWYEKHGDGVHDHEACRDPWVFPDPDGGGWHMMITAHGRSGGSNDRGVLGAAWSPDLVHWQARAPLTSTGAGFGQFEVPQTVVVDGAPVLIFSCLDGNLPARRRGHGGGVWSAPGDGLAGPFDLAGAELLLDERCYSGRLVQDRAGDWQLMAFVLHTDDGGFGGYLTDPMPVQRTASGTLALRSGGDPGHLLRQNTTVPGGNGDRHPR